MIKTEPPKKNNEKVKKTNKFFKKQSNEEEFEGQIIEDILEPSQHKKIENPYVSPTPQDAQTIENETKYKIGNFLKTASEFNKVDVAATKQKRDHYYDKLFNQGDRRQILDNVVQTDDMFIDDDYLFDKDDTQETKNICDYVLNDIDTDNALFEHVPVDNTLNHPSPPDPLPSSSDILLPKNKSIKRSQKKKKYRKMRQNRGRVRKAAKNKIQKLKKERYIQIDDTQTVN